MEPSSVCDVPRKTRKTQEDISSVIRQRCVIQCCYLLRHTASDTLIILKCAYGAEALSRSVVFRWWKHFREGNTNIIDKSRQGRPNKVLCEENIAKTKEALKENKNLSVRQLSKLLGISPGGAKVVYSHVIEQQCTRKTLPDDPLASDDEEDFEGTSKRKRSQSPDETEIDPSKFTVADVDKITGLTTPCRSPDQDEQSLDCFDLGNTETTDTGGFTSTTSLSRSTKSRNTTKSQPESTIPESTSTVLHPSQKSTTPKDSSHFQKKTCILLRGRWPSLWKPITTDEPSSDPSCTELTGSVQESIGLDSDETEDSENDTELTEEAAGKTKEKEKEVVIKEEPIDEEEEPFQELEPFQQVHIKSEINSEMEEQNIKEECVEGNPMESESVFGE